ncbi:MAG: phosphate-selective porin OprO/OprP [Oceanospirillaceae bacterium]
MCPFGLINPDFLLNNQEDSPLKIKPISLLIAGALMAVAVMPAHASNDAMLDLLKVLRDKGTITAQDFDLLAKAAKADKEVNQEVQANVEKITIAAAAAPKITTNGKIQIESADGKYTFRPIGRVMWDYLDTDEDGSGQDDIRGTELRRVRLGFQGKVDDYGYKFEGEFVGGDSSVKDAWINYSTRFGSEDNRLGLKLGQSHIQYGLNTKMSSKYMTFIDRPLFADSAVSPARESGAVLTLAAPDYSWMLSSGYTFGQLGKGDAGDDSSDRDGQGTTISLRGSVIPFMKDKQHMVQIGAGYLNLSGADEYRYRQRLVSHNDKTRHLDGSLASGDLDDTNAFTTDLFGIYGPLHTIAEYNNYTMNSKNNDDVEVDSYAVEVGYFLTGESMKWSKGYTSGLKPKSKYGAWQIAARIESTEIEGDLKGTDEADKFSLALNYYPTTNINFMLNYEKITDLTVNGINVDFEPSAFKFRANAYW